MRYILDYDVFLLTDKLNTSDCLGIGYGSSSEVIWRETVAGGL